MQLSLIQWLLISATALLQTAILTLMVKKNLRSKFPFFFNFVAFSLVSMFVPLALLRSPIAYAYSFWAISAIGTCFSFAVIYEVFTNILKPYSALVDLGKLLFRWAIGFLALASVLTAVTTNGPEASKIAAMIQVLERSCELMQCGLFLLIILFETRLGLSWRSPAICIMSGFGANAALSLIACFLQYRVSGWNDALSLISPVVCVAVYGCWCFSFALPQPERRTAQDSPTRLIFQRWNEALMATPLVSKKSQAAGLAPVESFLPGVEQTVERVMARKMMH